MTQTVNSRYQSPNCNFVSSSYNLSEITVHLGVNNLTGSNPNEVIRTISQVFVHPNYNKFTFDNDMCLLKLSSPVNFTNYLSPICLAAQGSTFYDGIIIWVTGFGVTGKLKLLIYILILLFELQVNSLSFSICIQLGSGSVSNTLQQVNVPVVGNNACSCYLQDFAEITGNMMCAGNLDGGRDSCQVIMTFSLVVP